MRDISQTLEGVANDYYFEQPFVKNCFDDTVIKMAKHGWSLNDFSVDVNLDFKTIIKLDFVYCTYKTVLPDGATTSRYIVIDEHTAKLID